MTKKYFLRFLSKNDILDPDSNIGLSEHGILTPAAPETHGEFSPYLPDIFSQKGKDFLCCPAFRLSFRLFPVFLQPLRQKGIIMSANPLGLPLYIISLVEHKSRVEYNVIMQVLRYMVYIWEDYEKDMERLFPGISSRKDFRYPPILPIVYYEGAKKWTAPADLADKILCGELLGKYLPHFRYQLIMLHEFSNEELLARKDEISLAMLINKIQTYEDVSAFSGLPQEQIQHILKNTPENILEIMAEILRALLYRIKLPENTVEDTVAKIKERKMGILFENVQMDFEEEKRKADEAMRIADEATRKADEVQRKADEQLQIYGEIIALLKQGNTDEEIIAHFMQCFSWSEEQAKEKAGRFLLSS